MAIGTLECQLLAIPSIIPQYTTKEIQSLTQERVVWEGVWLTSGGWLVLPKKQKEQILKQFHEALHVGFRLLLKFLVPLVICPHWPPHGTASPSSAKFAARNSPRDGLDLHPHSTPTKLGDRFPDKTDKLTLLICSSLKNTHPS